MKNSQASNSFKDLGFYDIVHRDSLPRFPGNYFVKIGLIIAASLILCNYYYFYFYGFEQGQVLGVSPVLSLLKVMALILFCFLMLSPVIRTKFKAVDVILFLSLLYFAVVFLLRRMIWDDGNYMIFNLFICLIPFFIFEKNKDVRRVFFFLDACLIILILQVFIDISIYLSGNSLWDNKAFIGGLGNPSSFGIICSVFLAYNLFLNTKKTFKFLASVVLLFGILMTSSMMSLFMAVLVVMTWVFTQNKFYFVIFSVVAVLVAVFIYEYILSDHLLYKLHSLFLLGADDSSRSVSLRIENYDFFFEQLTNNFTELLLFGYTGVYYYIADSQYLTNIGSFGLIGALAFFMTFIWYGVEAYKMKNVFGNLTVLVIAIFMLVFFTNRILDYYPVPLILFLIIMSSRSITRGRDFK